MERSGELAFPKSNVSTQLAGHYLQCSWTKADQARTEQSMNEKSEDSIDICSDFCLAFSVTRLILEPRSRRLFPRMGFRPSGRSFRGVQKASVLGSGLVRIPSAFGPQNTGKRDSFPVRGVPTGSGGQSGETSQSRDFPVRGSQSFQAVRKRLGDLGTDKP